MLQSNVLRLGKRGLILLVSVSNGHGDTNRTLAS